jgi:hypothetical protein
VKAPSILALGVILACALGLPANAQPGGGAPPADFGTPPSGTVPILFNDRHVYANPDHLIDNRVLAVLVRGNTIMVPMRSMFEQMGATVSWDQGTQTVDVSKPGADVKVTVGKPEVVINGESRPLDVPPEMYHGVVLIPVRVVSEGMGAYVQWVQDRGIVVVRYLQPPIPTPPPTPAPTPKPYFPTPRPATPAPVAPSPPPPPPVVKNPNEAFIVGDYLFAPKVYNEFNPGSSATGISFTGRAAIELPVFGLPWMLEGDYRSYSYPHDEGLGIGCYPDVGSRACVTVIGAYGRTAVPSFTARDTDFDGRLGLKIAEPRIYIGVGYLHREENYGYPIQTGFGFGAEKLPDLQNTFSVYGSVWYYPTISGNFTFPVGAPPALVGTTDKFQQRFLKYQVGGTLNLGNSGLFLDAGFLGDTIRGQSLSPSDASHAGGYVGLGIKF